VNRSPTGDCRRKPSDQAPSRGGPRQRIDERYKCPNPRLSIDAKDRRSALEATRATVAEWPGVQHDAFDVES